MTKEEEIDFVAAALRIMQSTRETTEKNFENIDEMWDEREEDIRVVQSAIEELLSGYSIMLPSLPSRGQRRDARVNVEEDNGGYTVIVDAGLDISGEDVMVERDQKGLAVNLGEGREPIKINPVETDDFEWSFNNGVVVIKIGGE